MMSRYWGAAIGTSALGMGVTCRERRCLAERPGPDGSLLNKVEAIMRARRVRPSWRGTD